MENSPAAAKVADRTKRLFAGPDSEFGNDGRRASHGDTRLRPELTGLK